MNERITENIVRTFLQHHLDIRDGQKVTVYEQSTDLPRIQKLLKHASKRGKGQGHPEFIVTFPSPYSDFVIVVECKADVAKHESVGRDQFADYAVDGALLYASYLSKELDVLAIAVSGQKVHELRVSHFLQLKGSPTAKPLQATELLSMDNCLDLYLYDPDKEKQSFEGLLDYSRQLNEYLRDIDLAESHRPLLVSGVLIALKDEPFTLSYTSETRPSDLAGSLVDTIVKVLDKNNIRGAKKANMVQSYGFIRTHSVLADDTMKDDKYNTVLRDLITAINENVNRFTKTYQYYDVLGKFYAEFLRYANGDKTLGIVLTPQHITELFVELAEVNETSVVLDNCCGTGGFLISAMKRMIMLCGGNQEKERRVYTEGLVGVESNSNMFSLACSNMMIRGDGKSNVFYGSCFDKVDEVRQHKPTVGLLNPPYAKKKEDEKELNFVLNNLACLEPGSLCAAIVPISCAIDDPLKQPLLEKHTLEAVMSMPEELFYDSDANTVTCIMVFRAHVPHRQSGRKTWFGYWRNDGYVKTKKEGRIDLHHTWDEIRAAWIEAYKNREAIDGISLMRKVDENDEWCAEAYLEADYSTLTPEDFRQVVQNYLLFTLRENA